MDSTITIEEYQPAERPRIIQLMSEFGEYLEAIDELKQTQYDDKGAEYFVERMIQKTREMNGQLLVALDGADVIGFIQGHITLPDQDEQMETIHKKIGVIDEFFVSAKHRSKGIGKALIESMEQYLISHDCDVIRLAVFAPNSLARGFYAKMGYQDRMITVSKYPSKNNPHE